MDASLEAAQRFALTADQLLSKTDPATLGFATTDEVAAEHAIIGQERAMDAIRFGVTMDRKGYNLFVLGPPGIGKHALLLRDLTERALAQPIPADLCYVHNFAVPHQPTALVLPASTGALLRRDMALFAQEIQPALAAALESDEFRARSRVIEQAFKTRQEEAFNGLRAQAAAHNLVVLNTAMGIAFAPRKGDEVIEPEAFGKLPPDEQHQIEQDMATLSDALRDVLAQLPRWERESRDQLRTLARDVCAFTLSTQIADERERYAAYPTVLAFLDAVLADILDHAQAFVAPTGRSEQAANSPDRPTEDLDALARRYLVNVLVDHTGSAGAPVVYEDNPTLANLLGRVEYRVELGALVTDHNHIKPGALHRANGGYLILDAAKILLQPWSWAALKRGLFANEARIEAPGPDGAMASTVSLEPGPTPLAVKVVLIGDRSLYYLLAGADPDFGELFKVVADFEDDTPRNRQSERAYGQLLATIVRRQGLRAFDATAIAAVVDASARAAEDAERLSTAIHPLTDLMNEADHWASERQAGVVTAEDVAQAIAAGRRREGRMADRLREQILRSTLWVATSGSEVGQVNGLSVLQLGSTRFGQPSRITARTWLGAGEVVDIEREAELGGPQHSKGVLILTGFLSGRYARAQPLSLAASLVFEQTYGGVDGDSASAAELYALLSAIADVPVRQSIALTGSVDQHGRIQAIGGVNEKIEGFFDVCQARGLTGEQGVIIPRANVIHLMLRPDVVAAAVADLFHVWAIGNIDEGIPLLMGIAAGSPDAAGTYPSDSLNGLVVAQLDYLAARRRAFSAGSQSADS